MTATEMPPSHRLRMSVVAHLDPGHHDRLAALVGDSRPSAGVATSLLFPLVLSGDALVRLVTGLLVDEQLPGVVHLTRAVRVGAVIPLGIEATVSVDVVSFTAQTGGGLIGLRTTVSDGPRVLIEADDRALVVGPVALDPFGTDEAPVEPRRMTLRPSATIDVPTDVGRRWADVSGDHQPIHLDDTVARSFGFERAIAHGAYTLAATLHSLVHVVGDHASVRAVRCAFARPVYPGDTLRVDVSEPADDGTVQFRVSARGKPVLRAGVLELDRGAP